MSNLTEDEQFHENSQIEPSAGEETTLQNQEYVSEDINEEEPPNEKETEDGDNGKEKNSGELALADDNLKLFVGGLSWETTEDDLTRYFEEYGPVEMVGIKLDRLTKQSRGFGFVVFKDAESIEKVICVKEHRLNNKQIDPKRAKPTREVHKKIFVGGLDPDVTEEQIRELFGQFGKIENLELPFDSQKGKRRAYIFVTYTTEDEAKAASTEPKQDLFGKRCDVRICLPQEHNKKKFNSYPQPWNNYGGGYSYGYGGGFSQPMHPGYGGYGPQYGSYYQSPYGAPAPPYYGAYPAYPYPSYYSQEGSTMTGGKMSAYQSNKGSNQFHPYGGQQQAPAGASNVTGNQQ